MNPSLSATATATMASAVELVLPEVALVGTACFLFLAAAFTPRRSLALLMSLIGLAGTATVAWIVGPTELQPFSPGDSFNQDLLYRSVIDPTGPASYVRWLAIGLATVLVFLAYSETTDRTAGEYYGCLMVVAAGVSLIGRANDLVTLYLALEMLSIPTYILLYLPGSTSRAGQEVAVKYFLLSVLSAGLMLFGFSYLYGLTGTTNLTGMIDVLNEAHRESASPLAMLGMVLAIAGLGFRITAVPFHFYAPDVYESGPTGVIGGLAVIPKVGGFVALAKLLGMLYPPMRELPFDTHTLIPFVLLLLSMLTMSFGNVLALMQDNLKRILAYSGIAHAGYMLLGLASAGAMPSLLAANPPATNGVDAILFYLVAYGLMTAAAFAVLMAVDRPDRPVATVDDLAGLGSERPLAAACLAVALLSMIGLPLTAGFPGKLQLFLAAFEAPTNTSMGLAFRSGALLMALNAAIAAVYYLRILGALYLRTPLKPFAAGTRLTALLAALLCTVGTLVIGIYPKPLGDAAKQAAPFSDPKFRASSRPAR